MQTIRRAGNRDDRAVSEAIGFILIFAIIIAGIGMVTLYGYPMLLQQQSSSNEQIMEKNMIVLQNDLKSLAYKTVPYQETSLKVDGGALTVYNMSYNNATESHFSIYDQSGIIAPQSHPIVFYPGDLQYESTSAQTDLSLENGAVLKRMIAQTGSTMLAEPRWFYDGQTNTAVIYLIGFESTDVMALEGVGTVKMDLDQGNSNYTVYNIPSTDTIHVEYMANTNADYSTGWENYFTGTLGMISDGIGGYQFDPTPTTVVIYTYEIVIESV
jgi:hypothetical protein